MYNKPLNYNHTPKESKVEVKESLQELFLMLALKSLFWDNGTPDGQATSEALKQIITGKFQHSYSPWLSAHLWVLYSTWLIGLSKQTKPSLSNCKKDTRAGSTLSEEFLSNKGHISFSKIRSHFMLNTFWVHSQHFTLLIGSRIRLPLCGELQTLLCGRQSGSPQASQHT